MKRALVALVLVVLASCGVAVGDSISVPIPSDGVVVVNAAYGRTAYNPGRGPAAGSGVEALRMVVPHVPNRKWVIVELGTNDVSNPISTLDGRIDALMREIPKTLCVAFVSVWRANSIYRDRILHWNLAVRSKIKQFPCRAIIEWMGAARVFPSLLGGDGIHPTPAGTRWLHDEYHRVSALPWGAYL